MKKTFSGPLKSIHDVTLSTWTTDGVDHIKAEFGTYGWIKYRDMDEARLELDGWADDKINELVSQLAGVTKLKRWLAKQ